MEIARAVQRKVERVRAWPLHCAPSASVLLLSPPRFSVRVAFIVNPASRHGRARAAHARLPARAAALGLDASFHATEGPRHAVALARRFAADHDAVVAVGGDGTVHEVAVGLIGAGAERRAALGVVPLGTGNDFAKLLAAGTGEAALDALPHLTPRPFDVLWLRWTNADGSSGEEPFVNTLGLGLDGFIASLAPRYKGLGNTLGYLTAVLHGLARFRAPRVALWVDGAPVLERRLHLVSVGNGTTSGGSYALTPFARPDDGRLDAVALDAVPLPRLLYLLPLSAKGRHVGKRGVTMLQGTRLDAAFDPPVPFHADGEVLTTQMVRAAVTLAPGALPVLG